MNSFDLDFKKKLTAINNYICLNYILNISSSNYASAGI